MTRVTVVVGAQFGSEGKGAITGHLAKTMQENDVVIRVAGPNAGHTAYDDKGREWKLRTVPVAAVTNHRVQLHLAAGSEIDLDVLADEILTLETFGIPIANRLTIHPSATVLTDIHKSREREAGLVGRVGSTGKGIGAARADRIMRRAVTFGEYAVEAGKTIAFGSHRVNKLLSTPGPFDLSDGGDIVIEGTQGYGLGLHTQFYPQVTSSDCRAIDFLAMAGISPWASRVHHLDVVLVARTLPIRVAGNSGPLAGETTWAQLGLPEERTTVTNNIRRVGTWDEGLVLDAIEANGGGGFNPHVQLALTMVDQVFPSLRDQTTLDGGTMSFIKDMEKRLQTHITYVGTGPNTVIEL